MTEAIAIVGMACEYPDARSPEQLWENVIAQRQAFRPLPPERLRLEDYPAADERLGLGSFRGQAAVLEGYAFDRQRFRISGSAYRTVDVSHWLALDCADRALRDAGFADGAGLPSESTGVLMGNTLTGDYSRAASLQLRWPYVLASVTQGLDACGLSRDQHPKLLPAIRSAFLAQLPDLNADTLAGWLSNTIAGRICNYFNLKGGGYVVDGACASSLLAISTACTALTAGDLDVAIAGGVDLSIDPFELVGFARAGALAPDDMRPYDRRASGFWPGEGCGVVVLMRASDAAAQRRPVRARLLGWGVSSDGHGGITRPELDGQLHAIRRAYRRAGLTADSVALFEGHGTGTRTGDEVELQALTAALTEANAPAGSAALGSVKANIGHTKAAAGVAGVIKTVMALSTGVLPPATGCATPAAPLDGTGALRVLQHPEPWPSDRPRRAGVSAMGFGGINVHVVLEGAASARQVATFADGNGLARHDAELVPLAARDADDLRDQLSRMCDWLGSASRAELSDLAVHCQRQLPSGKLRVGFVARSPAGLIQQCEELLRTRSDDARLLDVARGTFLGTGTNPVIGLLCSGQASPKRSAGGAWSARFPEVGELYEGGEGSRRTGQECIVRASLAALRVMARSGISAHVAVGHSLGELTALHWAGALHERALLELVHERARAMEGYGLRDGAMAAIGADLTATRALIAGQQVAVACLNGPRQTVVSGDRDAVDRTLARARAAGFDGWPVKVPQAFHSPHMAAATAPFGRILETALLAAPSRAVYSTVLGRRILEGDSVRQLLGLQLTSPVRFAECIEAAGGVDLWIEAGPGDVLATLVREQFGQPALALDACGDSLEPWLQVVAAAYALGAPVAWDALAADRFCRPVDMTRGRRFLANPCGLLRQVDPIVSGLESEAVTPPEPAPADAHRAQEPLAIALHLVAERTELSLGSVQPHHRLLSDLHLNSMAVGVIASDLSRALGLHVAPISPGLTDATVMQLVDALLAQSETPRNEDELTGIAPWVRPFRVEFRPVPPSGSRSPARKRCAPTVTGDLEHPSREAAAAALSRAGGGVLVCLPPDPDSDALFALFTAAQQAAQAPEPLTFVVIHRNGGARGLCRTLALEAPQHNVLLAEIAPDHESPERALFEEISRTTGFREVQIRGNDERCMPFIVPLTRPADAAPVLSARDVVLVSGGGSGISAECGLALARTTGCRLALTGRSARTAAHVRSVLERCDGLRIDARYEPGDIRDGHAVVQAVQRLQRALGPITFVVHGAGLNEPRLLRELDDRLFRDTLETKLHGARNLLAAIDLPTLRGFVAFGSVIAQMGLPGEAHYAAANELLALFVDRMSRDLPHCRCLTIDWSVWTGAGMGERLNRIGALERQGVTPISLDQGVELFLRLVHGIHPCTEIVASGRLGHAWQSPDVLPFGRFIERPRVHVPEVELVADADLSLTADPYLSDHRLDGALILPAVISLEAMAQTAQTLLPHAAHEPAEFHDVTFDHPIVVEGDRVAPLRGAGLAVDEGIAIALRTGETRFLVDHARGTYLQRPAARAPVVALPATDSSNGPAVDVTELYDSVLFQGPRFRRVRRYHSLRARHAVVELEAHTPERWFGPYLPQTLVLGDPGVRDAAIHAVQACIPDRRIVPTGVDSLWIRGNTTGSTRMVTAVERSQHGATFLYDLVIEDGGGSVCEVWQGLRLKAIAPLTPAGGWPVALLGPLLERAMPAASGLRVLAAACADRTGEGRALARRLIGGPVTGRVDGRPEAAGCHVSATHAGGIGLAVAASAPVACDVEPVLRRPRDTWCRLLGRPTLELADLIIDRRDFDAAATRLWCVRECLHKLGRRPTALAVSERDGDTVVLRAGDVDVITRKVALRPTGIEFVVALALEHPAVVNPRHLATAAQAMS